MKASTYRPVPLLFLVLIVGLSLVAGIWLITRNGQPAGNVESFPRSGHNVRGDFLAFFRSNGGLAIFGYPITDELAYQGRIVQYFQNARMELHPEADAAHRVQLADLAEEMGLGTPPVPAPASDPEGRYFAEKGHFVGAEFLRFYVDNGGAAIFGYPITEVSNDRGVKSQYFQRARMDAYSDRPQPRLAALGDAHFDYVNLDPIYRKPNLGPARPDGSVGTPGVTIGKVDAQVERSYIWYPERQTLHVFVTGADNHGIAGVIVLYTIDYPDGSVEQEMDRTDASGHTSATFDVQQLPIGQRVVVRVEAVLDAVVQRTQTSFVLWP